MNNLFAQDGAGSMAITVPDPASLIFLLVFVALVLGVSTIFSVRGVSWTTGLKHGLGSLLWASPVVAVLALVATRVLPQFQFGGAPVAYSTDDSPSWLQTDYGSEDVEDVESFPETEDQVSLDEGAELPEWTEKPVQRLIDTRYHGNPSPVPTKSPRRDDGVQQRATLPAGEEFQAWRVVKEGQWENSEEAARESVLNEVGELVQKDFSRFYPGGSEVPKEAIREHALRAEAVTHQVFNQTSKPFTMYKVYWQVELSPEVREQLSESWKADVGVRRAWLFGGIFALLTLMAGTFAAYFHLDKRSKGAHRFRLKLAAAAMMTAGSLGLLAALPNV